MNPRHPSFRALLLNLLDDEEDSDTQVLADLEEMGIDIAAASRQLDAHVAAHDVATRRNRLSRARIERLSHAQRRTLARPFRDVPTAELVSRIQSMGGAAAHRDYTAWSREDLESAYEDLLALQERRKP